MKPGHQPSSRVKREREAADSAALAEAPASAEREDLIRRIAYDYYQKRGRAHGHELDDWLRAETVTEPMNAAPGGDASQGH